MDSTYYDPRKQQKQGGARPRIVLVIVLLIMAGATIAVLFPPIEGTSTGIPVSRKVSDLVYSASVERELGQPVDGTWLLPTAVVHVGDATFVLDTGNNRILKLDEAGAVTATLDRASDERLDLRQPMAMTSDGQRLIVANSLAAQILVLSTSGQVEKVVTLERGVGENTPRPIGVAVSADGGFIVSDADNHRVLILDSDGHVLRSLGTGTRVGGSDGFNVPGALALDPAGNIYVVDTLNGRVVKLSPAGRFLQQFGQFADTAGSLARPKGVAVDASGRVFVSDGLQAVIEVFGRDGTYLGVIGRRDPSDPKAGSLFEAPFGLSLTGDQLDVIDGIAGLITLRLDPPAQPTTVAG
jgi:DNA-binding beta-propeller fold protein YncE